MGKDKVIAEMSKNDKPNLVIPITICVVVLAPFVIWDAWSYIWWNMWRDRTVRDVLPSVSDWPYAIQELHSALIKSDPNLKMDGYLMYGEPGPFSADEAAFRIHNCSKATFSALKSELQLVEIAPDHRMAGWGRIVVEKANPEWWVSADEEGNYYACQNLRDGEEGPLFVVAHATVTNTIYISYHFNF